jgi:hypothetical protein
LYLYLYFGGASELNKGRPHRARELRSPLQVHQPTKSCEPTT